MLSTFIATLPIFLLILSGYVLKRIFVPDAVFWTSLEKLIYYIFFPSMLIVQISKANFNAIGSGLSVTATIIATIAIALLTVLFKILFKIPNASFTSVFQGGIRYNSYIFLALSEALFGAEGLALAGFFMAYMIVLNNIFCVSCLNFFGTGHRKNIVQILLSIFKNPLMVGALIGLLLNVLQISLPEFLYAFLHHLGAASMATSCLAVGAGLVLKMELKAIRLLSFASVLKLVLMPLTTLILLKILSVPQGTAYNIALLYSTIGCAGNAYILSRQMGGDSPLMASIITWTTLGSCITIPIIMGIFRV